MYVNVKPRKGYKFAKSLFGKYENIPEDWDIKKLADIGKIVGGGTPNSKNEEYWSGDVLWAVPTDITKLSTTYIHDTGRKITKKGLDNCSAKLLPIGTILLTSRATMGECAISTRPMSTNQGFQSIVCNNMFYNVFVFYLMRFNRNTIIRLSYGTTFLEISKKEIEKVLVPVPNSLTEQQKIASILSGVDANIETTQKVIDKTERLKTSLMQRLLTRGIGHTKFKKVKWLFGKEIEIPEQWELSTIENIGEKLVSGGTPSTTVLEYWNGNIPWTRSSVLIDPYLKSGEKFITIEGLENSSSVLIPKNNLLVSSRVSVGNVSINIIDVAISQDVTGIIINKSSVQSEFLYWYLKQHIKKLVLISQGTTIQGFTRKELAKMMIFLPTLSEQTKIASILSGVDAYIQKNQEYKKTLEKLKKGLMQKLLTGQIRVKV